MFIINWLFDKLGYMPKIVVDAGVVETWPFPAPKTKPAVKKKPAAKKVIVPKATTISPYLGINFIIKTG